MKRYARVIEILDTAVKGDAIKAHGNFWRGKARHDFIALKVFGQQLVDPGHPENSAVIKALRGLAPFGSDVTPHPVGAVFRRMPAGRPPVPDASIAFVEQWIKDGCPDDETAEATLAGITAADVNTYVRFFREFDNFFMFEANPDTQGEIGAFFGLAPTWPGLQPAGDASAWATALGAADVSNALTYLSDHQLTIMRSYFSTPLNQPMMADALWLFGCNQLPPDPLRPADPRHKMDGAQMWLFWLAFADACIRRNVSPSWPDIAKSICFGMVGDALFRTDRPPAERLKINRYRADDPDVRRKIGNDFDALSGVNLLDAIISLAREAMFGAPSA